MYACVVCACVRACMRVCVRVRVSISMYNLTACNFSYLYCSLFEDGHMNYLYCVLTFALTVMHTLINIQRRL